jgi:hypothetical protein
MSSVDEVPPGTPAMAGAELAVLLSRLAATDAEQWTQGDVQNLFTAAVQVYCARLDQADEFPPFMDAADVTATDAVRVASAILEAVNLETFELALWQTWGGRPWFGKNGVTT